MAELVNRETYNPVLVVPKDFQLIDLEEHMEFRTHYRQTFRTKNLKDFIKYNKEFQQEGAKCFIDQDNMLGLTTFDLGSVLKPLHKAHRANIQLRQTAAYQAILDSSYSPLSQKNASDFLEDWEDNIKVFTSAGDAIPPRNAAALLRDMTIETAKSARSSLQDFSQEMSEMEKIEARNANSLPAEIEFKCVPYQNLEQRAFTLRLSILTSSDAPKMSLRIARHEQVIEEMAEEFKDLLVQSC